MKKRKNDGWRFRPVVFVYGIRGRIPLFLVTLASFLKFYARRDFASRNWVDITILLGVPGQDRSLAQWELMV